MAAAKRTRKRTRATPTASPARCRQGPRAARDAPCLPPCMPGPLDPHVGERCLRCPARSAAGRRRPDRAAAGGGGCGRAAAAAARGGSGPGAPAPGSRPPAPARLRARASARRRARRQAPDAATEAALRKRKLLAVEAWKTYRLGRGPKFALERRRAAADLTPEMVARRAPGGAFVLGRAGCRNRSAQARAARRATAGALAGARGGMRTSRRTTLRRSACRRPRARCTRCSRCAARHSAWRARGLGAVRGAWRAARRLQMGWARPRRTARRARAGAGADTQGVHQHGLPGDAQQRVCGEQARPSATAASMLAALTGCGGAHGQAAGRMHGRSLQPTGGPRARSFWNFDALFQPQQHPARDAHDTFFLTCAPRPRPPPRPALWSPAPAANACAGRGLLSQRERSSRKPSAAALKYCHAEATRGVRRPRDDAAGARACGLCGARARRPRVRRLRLHGVRRPRAARATSSAA